MLKTYSCGKGKKMLSLKPCLDHCTENTPLWKRKEREAVPTAITWPLYCRSTSMMEKSRSCTVLIAIPWGSVLLKKHNCIHAYPKSAFSGKKITKIRNTVQHSGTHQQTYPHIYEINLAARFDGKITGQSTLPIPRSWEWGFCRSRATVCQSNHFTTALRTAEFM